MQSTRKKNQSAHQHQTHCENAKPPSKAQQLTFTFHDITCVTVQYIANIWVLFVFYYTTYLRTQNKNDNNNIIAYLLISAILECFLNA